MATEGKTKDYYSILGVDPGSDPAKLRAAYIARTKVLHPDRFDRHTHPDEWQLANELTADLNAAYEILSDAERRRVYDRTRQDSQRSTVSPPKPQSTATRARPDAVDPAESLHIVAGHARFSSLDAKARERMFARQAKELPNEFRRALSELGWWYFFMALAAAAVALAVYSFAADGARNSDYLVWLPFVVILLGEGITRVKRHYSSPLRPHLYITPLYIIRTTLDVVSVWPIWRGTFNTVHNHGNGIYRGSDVTLSLGTERVTFTLSSKKQYARMEQCVDTNRQRLAEALGRGDAHYVSEHNDFAPEDFSAIPIRDSLPRTRPICYAAAVVVCAIIAAGAYPSGAMRNRSDWAKMPVRPSPGKAPVRSVSQPIRNVTEPLPPVQRLPLNGEYRLYTRQLMLAPLEIRTSGTENHFVKLVDRWTRATVMDVFVRAGQTAEVDVPLGTYELRYASGHTWYGDAYLFGPSTSYSKSASDFVFREEWDGYSGYTVTLYKVQNGNMKTHEIRPEDF